MIFAANKIYPSQVNLLFGDQKKLLSLVQERLEGGGGGVG